MSMLPDTTAAPTRQARDSRRRSAAGLELQAAREAAGMTYEDVGRRIVVIWNIDSPQRNGGRPADMLGARDERYARGEAWKIRRMERATQGTYDRGVASLTEDRAPWRPMPFMYTAALQVIAWGPASITVDELADAVRAAREAEHRAREAAVVKATRQRAKAIARLVWNHAEAPEFLDRALLDELGMVGDGTQPVPWLGGLENYMVRCILMGLANQLRVTFPGRQLIDVSDGQP